MKRQTHVYYSGRVQGIGFRFTAVDFANELGITGWVKNLRDGRVEVIAEGYEDELKEFLDRLRKTFADYIADEEPTWQALTAEYKDFAIKY